MVDGVSANIGVAAGARDWANPGQLATGSSLRFGTMHSLFRLTHCRVQNSDEALLPPNLVRTPGAQVRYKLARAAISFAAVSLNIFVVAP